MNIKVAEGSFAKVRVNLKKMQTLQGWYQNPISSFLIKKQIIHDSITNPIRHCLFHYLYLI